VVASFTDACVFTPAVTLSTYAFVAAWLAEVGVATVTRFAEKSPLASRATIALAVFAEAAVV